MPNVSIPALIRSLAVVGLLTTVVGTAIAQSRTLWSNVPDKASTGFGFTHVVSLDGGKSAALYGYYDSDEGVDRAVVRCWDSDGHVLWNAVSPGPEQTTPMFLAKAPDGTLVMATSYEFALKLTRLDQDGVALHEREVFNTIHEFDIVPDIAFDASGNLFVASAQIPGFGLPDVFRLTKFDAAFNSIWEITGDDQRDIEVLHNGRVATCGNADSSGGSSHLAVYEADGTNVFRSLKPMTMVEQLVSSESNYVYWHDVTGITHVVDSDGLEIASRTLSDMNARTRLAFDEVGQSLYVVDSDPVLTVRCLDPLLNDRWTASKSVNMSGTPALRLDRFGNLIIGSSTAANQPTQNMTVDCIAPDGRWQWSNELLDVDSYDDGIQALTVDDALRVVAVGGFYNDNIPGYKGVAWRTSQYFNQNPDSVAVRLGRRILGNVASLDQDDGNEYVVARFVIPNQLVLPIAVEFDTVFPIDDVQPGTTDLRVYVRCRANTPNIAMWIQLYDWTTGTWTPSPNYGLFLTETSYESVHTNVGPYFQPGTRRVRARIAAGAVGPVSTQAFAVAIDQVNVRSDT